MIGAVPVSSLATQTPPPAGRLFYLFQRTTTDGYGDCLEVRLSALPRSAADLAERGGTEFMVGAWGHAQVLADYVRLGWPEVDGATVVACCELIDTQAAKGFARATASLPLPPLKYRIGGPVLSR